MSESCEVFATPFHVMTAFLFAHRLLLALVLVQVSLILVRPCVLLGAASEVNLPPVSKSATGDTALGITLVMDGKTLIKRSLNPELTGAMDLHTEAPALVVLPDERGIPMESRRGTLLRETGKFEILERVTEAVPLNFGCSIVNGPDEAPPKFCESSEPEGTLATLSVGGNGNSAGGAVFFDLKVTHAAGLRVQSIAVSTNTVGNLEVEIYTRTGSCSGFETAQAGWSLVSKGSCLCTSTDAAEKRIDVSDFTLAPGVTGVAIRNVNFSAIYTTGNGRNQVYSNADLILTGRSAQTSCFVTLPNRPRVWNGRIDYVKGDAPLPWAGDAAGGSLVVGEVRLGQMNVWEFGGGQMPQSQSTRTWTLQGGELGEVSLAKRSVLGVMAVPSSD